MDDLSKIETILLVLVALMYVLISLNRAKIRRIERYLLGREYRKRMRE